MAIGSSRRSRPFWRTPPKLTPLARTPAWSRSISVTFLPRRASCSAVAQPAIPAPITSTSLCSAVRLVHGRRSATVATETGLIGGWPRMRPTLSRVTPSLSARISAAAWPHSRPWQRPMPTRE